MMAVLGCSRVSLLDSDMSEAEVYLDFSKGKIEVEAASFYKGTNVTDTLGVTSSRSWSLNGSDDWFQLSTNSGQNLGEVTKNWSINMQFEDNPAADARTGQLTFFFNNEKKKLDVVQKAFEPVVQLKSESSYNFSDQGGEIGLYIYSNCNWTACVDDSNTAEVSLSAAEGYKTDSLKVTVNKNMDVNSGKEAVVVLSAEGLEEDVRINITQSACVPYLTVDENADTDVLPDGGDIQVPFSTNVKWTARLEDATEGVTLSVGDSAKFYSPAEQLMVNFPQATLDGASAKVVITTETGLEESVTFVQRGCVFITFRQWPDKNGYTQHAKTLFNPETGSYDIPRSGEEGEKAGTWVKKDSEGRLYTFFTGNTLGQSMFHSEACGLTIGSIVDNPAFYIEFPAIEGKALKEVKLMLGNSDVKFKDNKNCEATATGTKAYVTDPQGNVVSGGEMKEISTYQKDSDWNETATIPSFYSDYYNHQESMYDFVLAGTEPGTSYRYTGEYRQVIRWFILYYE